MVRSCMPLLTSLEESSAYVIWIRPRIVKEAMTLDPIADVRVIDPARVTAATFWGCLQGKALRQASALVDAIHQDSGLRE